MSLSVIPAIRHLLVFVFAAAFAITFGMVASGIFVHPQSIQNAAVPASDADAVDDETMEDDATDDESTGNERTYLPLPAGLKLRLVRYHNETKYWKADAEYPEIVADTKLISAKMRKAYRKANCRIKSIVLQRVKRIEAAFPRSVEENSYLADGNQCTSSVICCVTMLTPNLISMRFDGSTYTGGAHGSADTSALTCQLAPFKQLSFEDMFVKPVPYKEMSALVDARLQEKLEADYTAPTEMFHPKSFEHYMVTPRGIMIGFSAYEVAAYAVGTPSVLMPYGKIDSYLADGTPVKDIACAAVEKRAADAGENSDADEDADEGDEYADDYKTEDVIEIVFMDPKL